MDMNSAASTSSMQMIMDGSPTAASAAASSTAAMGGMDMGGGMGPNSCRISVRRISFHARGSSLVSTHCRR